MSKIIIILIALCIVHALHKPTTKRTACVKPKTWEQIQREYKAIQREQERQYREVERLAREQERQAAKQIRMEETLLKMEQRITNGEREIEHVKQLLEPVEREAAELRYKANYFDSIGLPCAGIKAKLEKAEEKVYRYQTRIIKAQQTIDVAQHRINAVNAF